MRLNFIEINEGFTDIKKLSLLKEESFPELKDITVAKIVSIHENKDGFCYAVYDDKKLIGFVVYIMHNNYSYVYLLAVDSKFRGMGYGTKILNELIQYLENKYSDVSILLDVECPDFCSFNYEQRKSRIVFYERLGFQLTDFRYKYHNIDYVLMIRGQIQDTDFYKQILDKVDYIDNKYQL